jgi:hypothetical protein
MQWTTSLLDVKHICELKEHLSITFLKCIMNVTLTEVHWTKTCEPWYQQTGIAARAVLPAIMWEVWEKSGCKLSDELKSLYKFSGFSTGDCLDFGCMGCDSGCTCKVDLATCLWNWTTTLLQLWRWRQQTPARRFSINSEHCESLTPVIYKSVYPFQFKNAGLVYLVDGLYRWQSYILFDICSVNECYINCSRYIRSGQNYNIRISETKTWIICCEEQVCCYNSFISFKKMWSSFTV